MEGKKEKLGFVFWIEATVIPRLAHPPQRRTFLKGKSRLPCTNNYKIMHSFTLTEDVPLMSGTGDL